VVNAQRLHNLLHGREADSFVVIMVVWFRLWVNVSELSKETSLQHHRSSVAGCARVRYDCLVFSRVAEIGASDLVEHGSP
jgi:hypothetical protein